MKQAHAHGGNAADLQDLHGRVSSLIGQLVSGRETTLALHRAVLDFADSAIARVRASRLLLRCRLPRIHIFRDT
jgi:hypothetical protein